MSSPHSAPFLGIGCCAGPDFSGVFKAEPTKTAEMLPGAGSIVAYSAGLRLSHDRHAVPAELAPLPGSKSGGNQWYLNQ